MHDSVLLWNEVSLEANRVSHTNGQGEQTGPTLSSRALAIVHLAMYDAFAGIVNDAKRLPRYLDKPPAPGIKESPEAISAAVAGAAHHALSELFRSQRPFFDSILASVEDPKQAAAQEFGVKVAKAILDDRRNDFLAGGDYKPSLAPFRHRPDPDNAGQGFHGPFYGQNRGFGIQTRHDLAPPPTSGDEYDAALREVRMKGIAPELAGLLPDDLKLPNKKEPLEPRTPDETVIGIYWAYDGASEIGTPPRQYNQIVRRVAKQQKNDSEKNVRLFAFVNVAMADAGILAWEQKYRHDLWRPVVGIREHDASFGPAAPEADSNLDNDADPQWLPLGAPNSNRVGAKNATPPFPAYPSGHATFGAAAFHITRLFYGKGGTLSGKLKDDPLFDGLDFVSDEFNGVTVDNRGTIRPRHRRNFPGGLWKMIVENGLSRVYLGVHWVFDAFVEPTPAAIQKKVKGKYVGGVPLGLAIAEDVFGFGKGLGPKRSDAGPLPKPEAAMVEGEETFSSTFLPATPGR